MAVASRTLVLWLLRAGQTQWRLEGRVQGAMDLPLAPAAKAAVVSIASGLKRGGPKVVHHSTDEAGTETARIYASALKARPKVVAELADPHMGLLEGLTEQEFEERYPSRHRQWVDDPASLAPPEGEEIRMAQARLFGAVARLLKRTRSEEIAVVLHDVALGLLRCWLHDLSPHAAHEMSAGAPPVLRYALTTQQVAELAEVERTTLASQG